MGCGTWDTDSFRSYSTSKGLTTDKLGFVTSSVSNQEMFKARDLDPALDPKDVIRECSCGNSQTVACNTSVSRTLEKVQ